MKNAIESPPLSGMKLELLQFVAAEKEPTVARLRQVFLEELGSLPDSEIVERFEQELFKRREKTPPPARASKTAPLKILLADDEPIGRTRTEQALLRMGHQVILAGDGAEAWEIWKKNRVRMVVTDWMMPGMDGLTLCRNIREAEGSRYTYLVLVTVRDNPEDILEGRNAGADEFLAKPFTDDELYVRVAAGARILSIQSREGVIFSMAKLVESRDPDTANHLERFRFFALTITGALAAMPSPPDVIDQLFTENIFLTSVLHDIGKVHVPESVLLKPGRLNETEFELVTRHCMAGRDALNDAASWDPNADYLRMAAEIAFTHHEKFDGSGYPQGLKGAAIPLSGRIAALCDVYDALVNKRPHKEPYSHETAKTFIQEQAGKHFDPMIVEAFLACEEKFRNIQKMFQPRPAEVPSVTSVKNKENEK